MPCARGGRARPPVSAAVALSLVVLYPSSSIFALAQFGDVPGAVSVSPIDPTDILDAIGLGGLFGGSKKPVVQLWYFWVCIAAAAIFVAAGLWFTYRGFKRWKSVREENRLKFLVPGAVAVQYFDEQTEDWIIDMSKRTGRSVEHCKNAGARHCAGQIGKSRQINRAMTFAASTMRRDRGVKSGTGRAEAISEGDDE